MLLLGPYCLRLALHWCHFALNAFTIERFVSIIRDMMINSLYLYEREIRVLITGGAGCRKISRYLRTVGLVASKDTVARWIRKNIEGQEK